MAMRYPECPNPDRAALKRVGEQVRGRLAEDPSAYKVPVEQAEIWAFGDFLSPDECDQVIALIDAVAKPSGILQHGDYSEAWRTSYSGDVDPSEPFIRMIERRIDDTLGIEHGWGETMQGQRYQPGQEFRAHMDWFWTNAPYWKKEAKRGGQRSFTAMIYLNDVEEGGTTDFTNIGISIPPSRGVMLVWNNACPDGGLNQDTIHAGTPVVKGVKYVITKWYRTREWTPTCA